MTNRNHCAHVAKFYELEMSYSDHLSDEDLFDLIGKALVYMVAEHH